jgi:hypothetical protein
MSAKLPQTFGDKASLSGLERCPGCHPERSEGSLHPSSQTLRFAQGDRHYLQISALLVPRLCLESNSAIINNVCETNPLLSNWV